MAALEGGGGGVAVARAAGGVRGVRGWGARVDRQLDSLDSSSNYFHLFRRDPVTPFNYMYLGTSSVRDR
jgi:hypothetical protein